nr:hypothetical protein Iba_chr04dCG15180 [Ipomoea batatas]
MKSREETDLTDSIYKIAEEKPRSTKEELLPSRSVREGQAHDEEPLDSFATVSKARNIIFSISSKSSLLIFEGDSLRDVNESSISRAVQSKLGSSSIRLEL